PSALRRHVVEQALALLAGRFGPVLLNRASAQDLLDAVRADRFTRRGDDGPLADPEIERMEFRAITAACRRRRDRARKQRDQEQQHAYPPDRSLSLCQPRPGPLSTDCTRTV